MAKKKPKASPQEVLEKISASADMIAEGLSSHEMLDKCQRKKPCNRRISWESGHRWCQDCRVWWLACELSLALQRRRADVRG